MPPADGELQHERPSSRRCTPPPATAQPAASSPTSRQPSAAAQLATSAPAPVDATPSLEQTLFPSGSEGGSPPPPRRRRSPTRSPSPARGEPGVPGVDADGSPVGDPRDGRSKEDAHGPATHGSHASAGAGGPPSWANGAQQPLSPAQTQHNASPGPSRPSPLPPTASHSTTTTTTPPPPPAAPAAEPEPPRLNLPVVSFRVVERPPRPSSSTQAQSYGFNPSGPSGGPPLFIQPPYLLRSVDPIDSDLLEQVEYDMDPQDYAWVAAVNAGYRRHPADPPALTDEFFTVALDRIEKEWWGLTKRIPNPRSQMPSEEEACAICDEADGENSNAIVFCDGCNLAVHQDCYGVPYIPEGQWLCRKCTVSPENPVSCVMCPSEGGAFKQTTTGQWAHLLCAIWIPETGVGNTVYMEPVDGVEMITKQRWKLNCSLCKKKTGACIQCENKACYTAFHPTCAREAGLLGSMKTYGDTGGVLKAFCERHIPPALKATNDAKKAQYHSHQAKKTKKSARAHAKRYEVPPPLLPEQILRTVVDYVKRLPGGRKRELVERIGRYWSLKREARRGAPLLKRLHLEPWTAADLASQKTEEEKEMQLAYLSRTRQDLEQVRMLNGMVQKREKAKLAQVWAVEDILTGFIRPFMGPMYGVIKQLRDSDKRHFFDKPVDLVEFPEYTDYVKRPMCFTMIEDALEEDKYKAFSEFEADVLLIFSNAMTFNPPAHVVHKAALKTLEVALPLLAELRAHVLAHSFVDELIRPHRDAWQAHYLALGLSPPPPFPQEELLVHLLGPGHEPIDSLQAHPDMLALLNAPLDDGSGQTFLQSLFDFKYEPEPLPEPVALEPVAEASAKQETAPAAAPAKSTTRIRLKQPSQAPTAAGEQPARMSSRKRPRDETSVTLPAPNDSAVAEGDDVEDPAVLEKRRLFAEFEKPQILPEGSSRRKPAATVPLRPNNVAQQQQQQQHQDPRKKATRKETRVLIPPSFVPNVKVPKRRPKTDKSKKVTAPAPAGPAPGWDLFFDDSDLSSLSSNASEVASESEPEPDPSEEVLQVEPRKQRAYSVSDGEEDKDAGQGLFGSDIEEIALDEAPGQSGSPRKKAAPSPARSRRAPAPNPLEPLASSPRSTRLSPVSGPVELRRAKAPHKQSTLRQHFEADDEGSEDVLSAVASAPPPTKRSKGKGKAPPVDEDDGSMASLFGSDESSGEERQGGRRSARSNHKFAAPSTSRRTVESDVSTPRAGFRSLKRGPAPQETPDAPSSKPHLALSSASRTRSSVNREPEPPSGTRRQRNIVNRAVPTTAQSRKTPSRATNVSSPAHDSEAEVEEQIAGPSRRSGRHSLPSADDSPAPALHRPSRPVPTTAKASARRTSLRVVTSAVTSSPAKAGGDDDDVVPESPEHVHAPALDNGPKPITPAPRPAAIRRTSRALTIAEMCDPVAEPALEPELERTSDHDVEMASASEGEPELDAPAAAAGPSMRPKRRASVARDASVPREIAPEEKPASLSKAARRRSALQAAEAHSSSQEVPLPMSNEGEGVSSVAQPPPPPPTEPVEEEYTERGRLKRTIQRPKRFIQDDVAPLSELEELPATKKQRRAAPTGDVGGESVAEDEPKVKAEAKAKANEDHITDDEEEEDETYRHGTLVWCHSAGHPWYPGEIVVPCEIDHEDMDDPEVPLNVHRDYKAKRAAWLAKGGDAALRPFIVHFFDPARVYGIEPPKNLSQLGEDLHHDRDQLEQKTKHKAAKLALFDAYARAWETQELELPNPLPPWFIELKEDVKRNKRSTRASKGDSAKPKTSKKEAKHEPVVGSLNDAPPVPSLALEAALVDDAVRVDNASSAIPAAGYALAPAVVADDASPPVAAGASTSAGNPALSGVDAAKFSAVAAEDPSARDAAAPTATDDAPGPSTSSKAKKPRNSSAATTFYSVLPTRSTRARKSLADASLASPPPREALPLPVASSSTAAQSVSPLPIASSSTTAPDAPATSASAALQDAAPTAAKDALPSALALPHSSELTPLDTPLAVSPGPSSAPAAPPAPLSAQGKESTAAATPAPALRRGSRSRKSVLPPAEDDSRMDVDGP